jgi:hypothetical protein
MARTFNKITRSNMRALKVGAQMTEQGITFERLANGDGAFSVNVMVDGKRIHRSLGRESEGVTRTTAEEFITKVKRDAREGPLNLPKRRKIPLTFAAAVPLYIERLRKREGRRPQGSSNVSNNICCRFLEVSRFHKLAVLILSVTRNTGSSSRSAAARSCVGERHCRRTAPQQ